MKKLVTLLVSVVFCLGMSRMVFASDVPTIPANATTIESYAFWQCSSLKSIALPNTITSIEDHAFYECSNLTSIEIPRSVASIRAYAFHGCDSLTDVYYKGSESEWKFIFIDVYNEPLMKATIHYNNTGAETGEPGEPVGLPFVDVTQADWFYVPTEFVFSRKIMTGMDSTHFGPAKPLSRAQFATILYRMKGSPEVAYDAGAFPDVAEKEFFTSPAIWAKSTGVITGYANGNFGPADDITREQMAVMMYRYANMLKLDTSVKRDLGSFPDGSSVSGFAQEAMRWAVGTELIQGDSGKINPQGKAERGQCATIIIRYMRRYGL